MTIHKIKYSEFKKVNGNRILEFIKINRKELINAFKNYLVNDLNGYFCNFLYRKFFICFFENPTSASEIIYFLYGEITKCEEIEDNSDYGIFGLATENKHKRQEFCKKAINYLTNLK